jgi:SPP1 family predicted phage head-tail adaptor
MQAGRLRHRLMIQKPTDTLDDFGAPSRAWSAVATVWGADEPLQGRERFEAQQVAPELSRRVRIRYKGALNTAMRILSPRATTLLAAAITTTDGTAITVTADFGVTAGNAFRVLIDSELMEVTAGHGTTSWTVTRGVDGTTAAVHASGAQVRLLAQLGIQSIVNHDERDRELQLLCTETQQWDS